MWGLNLTAGSNPALSAFHSLREERKLFLFCQMHRSALLECPSPSACCPIFLAFRIRSTALTCPILARIMIIGYELEPSELVVDHAEKTTHGGFADGALPT